jgi:hypothetical protein
MNCRTDFDYKIIKFKEYFNFIIKKMQNFISKSQLFDVFSSVNSKNIPFINQEEYLVDGKFKPWNGPFNEIHSAICKPTSE